MVTSAEIQWYDRNRDGVVEYFIKVVCNGRQWSIKRRYKEFAILHDFMIKEGMEVPYPLPPKYTFRRRDNKMLQKRRKELQMYLDSLLGTHSLTNNRFLKEFLDVDMGLLGFTLQRTKMSSNVDILLKMQTVPDQFSKMLIEFYSSSRGYSQKTFHSNWPHSPMSAKSSFTMLRKSKSLSFSTAVPRSFSRVVHADSFALDPSSSSYSNNSHIGSLVSAAALTPSSYSMRERKMSLDYFMLGSGVLSSVEQHRAAQTSKAFVTATNNVWQHYRDDIDKKCERFDRADGGEVDMRVIWRAVEEGCRRAERGVVPVGKKGVHKGRGEDGLLAMWKEVEESWRNATHEELALSSGPDTCGRVCSGEQVGDVSRQNMGHY